MKFVLIIAATLFLCQSGYAQATPKPPSTQHAHKSYVNFAIGGPFVPGSVLSISYYRSIQNHLAFEIGVGSAILLNEVFAQLNYEFNPIGDGQYLGIGSSVGMALGFSGSSKYFGASSAWGYQWLGRTRQSLSAHFGWNFTYQQSWRNGSGRETRSSLVPSLPIVGVKYAVGF